MAAEKFGNIERCLACGAEGLSLVMDLGTQPLANAFHDGDADMVKYPLQVNYCGECFHVQLSYAVDPEILYRDYPYVSGTSRTLRKYFEDFAERAEREAGNPASLRVLDIASNDGSLLRVFKERGHKVVFGVDPAGNLKPDDIPTFTGFWGAEALEAALRVTDGIGFDAVVAMNVLGHVSDPREFLLLAKGALADGGRLYVQTSQAEMIKTGEFDTVYHEHLSYFTASSWHALAERCGLFIEKMEIVDIHGGSWLVTMTKSPRPYETFSWRANGTLAAARTAVSKMREAGYGAIGYGAAAKGMTFLNVIADCEGLSERKPLGLRHIIDDAPLKIGKMCPGLDIEVVGSEVIEGLPERTLFVVLAWNFFDEIKARILEKRTKPHKFKFMVCFPEVRIV